MNVARVRFGLAVATLGLIVGASPAVYAVSWFDDFNDGDTTDGTPVTWLENLGGSPFFPGSYDASSGDYVLDPADDSPSGQMSALVLTPFSNTYMRTQGKVIPDPIDPITNDGGFLALTARIDPETVSGYLVFFDAEGELNLQIILGGEVEDLAAGFVAPFDSNSEVVLELNIVGNELSAYVWLADDPNGKPAAPQVTATNDFFAGGVAGLGFDDDGEPTSCVYRYATAQDTPFVDGQVGDHDGDDDVDGEDLLIIQRGIGGAFDGGDIADFKANYGETPSVGAASAVPEPTGLVAMMIAAAAAGRWATRRPRR